MTTHLLAKMCGVLFELLVKILENTTIGERCCRQGEGHCGYGKRL